MEFRILNESLVAVGMLDTIESIILTERYDEPGDFEIFSKFSYELDSLLQEDYYLTSSGTTTLMIIESKEIKSDPENGDKIVVRGRSFESTLDRRIILKQIIINGSLQGGIQTILNQNVAAGEFPQRDFPNFVIVTSTDPIVTSLNLVAQYYTENVLDVITLICRNGGIGFKITLNSSNQFVFTLYAGADRSYSQITNPFVVFSPNFDNLISSNYFKSKRNKRNWAFIAGKEGLANWNNSYYGRWAQIDTFDYDGGSGLALREIFVDANALSTTNYDSASEIPEAEYIEQLEQIGYQELAKGQEVVVFDAEVDVSKTYKYGMDFFLGDIIQYMDHYGHTASARVVAVTISENLSGSSIYPTLRSI